MNTFGERLKLTTFGESHGPAIGGVIDGMPAGLKIDMKRVQRMVDRRRPGTGPTVTARREADKVEVLSGIYEGVTLGTPIGFIVRNQNQHSGDYESLRHTYRPSHADYTYTQKYGIRDHRGGGRASARETVARVVAGAIAMQVLEGLNIAIEARVASVGHIVIESEDDMIAAREMIVEAKNAYDSLGGVIACSISGDLLGLGDPVFGKLQSRLAAAMLSIPAVKGFEYGMGFEGCALRGSEVIDEFDVTSDGRVVTATNHSGGIQGGIANGMPIEMRVAFKPVASISRPLHTVNDRGERVIINTTGRHDPCVVERAVPIVESMAALVILDAVLCDAASVLDSSVSCQ